MELKSLWLGLVLSMAAFSIKTGLGWAYLWSKFPPGRRLPFSLAVLALYALMFTSIMLLVSHLDLTYYFEMFQPLWQGGQKLHWLVAALMMAWGLNLLSSKPESHCCQSRGWLVMILPCPVCFSVVLMSSACLIIYFPQEAVFTTFGLFLTFIAIATASGLMIILGKSEAGVSTEYILGLSMMVMASYFILSALVMPQFADIGRIYRLASYSTENSISNPRTATMTSIITFLLVISGYLLTRHRLQQNFQKA